MLGYLNVFRKKIGYTGWTGRGNLGDEALYAVIHKLLSPIELVKFTPFYKKGKPLEALQKSFLSGMMMGSGTLINSRGLLPIMRDFVNRLPTFAFGGGVLDPEFYSEFGGYPNDMHEWVECLNSFNSVSVRGPLSANVLSRYGYKSALITGDPVLSLALDELPLAKRNNVIGINFGTTRNGSCLWGKSDTAVSEFILKLVNILLEKKHQIILFPVWEKDIIAAQNLAKKTSRRVTIWQHSLDMRDYMKAVEEVDVFIGEKLHSVIGALCMYKPSIMLAYQPKCIDFMMSVGLHDYTIKTDELSIDKVLFLVDTLRERYDQHRTNLFEQILDLKKRQAIEASKIIKIIQGS